ncbi:MAG: universal stress protein [Armatimonadota bacterium]|nr:universal stress protein [Armatimonadota bacterium]
MFQRMLVPLDGSRLAESVLPAARAMAARFGAHVTLLHVVERRPPAAVHGEPHLATVPEAEAYLADVARRLFAPERVTVHVHGPGEGDVATLIARHAEEYGSQLVVLCTHGSGAARDLLYGSVAQQVLSHGAAPVLLIRPGDRAAAFACQKILVPLDGSAASEAAVDPATAIAGAFDAHLRLLTVVPTLATVPTDRSPAALLLPGATSVSLEMEEEAIAAYLDGLTARLRSRGLAADAQVRRGDPSWEVAEAAGQYGADLLALATHGRSGISAVWAGSVASRIVARCRRPMLLVRAPGRPGGGGGI